MAINLKMVLDGTQGQNELSSILNGARQEILADIESKKSKANIGALEGRLNRIFYPIGTTSISADYYNRRMATSTEEQLSKVFNNFNFDDNKTGHYTAKVAIAPSTLQGSMNSAAIALKTLLEQISKTDSITELAHLEELQRQIEKLIKQGQDILDHAERSLQFGKERITGVDFENALSIVNQLMAFSKALSIPDFVTPQEAGILFEEALALTNYVEDSGNAFINEELRKLAINTTQFGAEAIGRGKSGLVSYSANIELMNDEKAKARGFKISKGNASYTYSYNPSSARQGKMDVQLYYNDANKDDYRVSAKRWSRGFGDLGETSIDAGITRAAGQSVAEAYKFAVLTPDRDWLNNETPQYLAAQAAHDFAVLALKSDIAMGLNQGKTVSGAGYANVLVIDTGSAIKVRDLATIVTSVTHQLNKYNSGMIESNANSIYNSMSNLTKGRTQSYLALMTSALNKMKVTINLSVIK